MFKFRNKGGYSQEYSITFTDDASVFENNSVRSKPLLEKKKTLKLQL